METWYTHGQWVDVSCLLKSGWWRLFIAFFVSPNSKPLKFVTLFFRTVRHTELKLKIHTDYGLIYCVYQTQSATAYLFLLFFFFFFFFFFPISKHEQFCLQNWYNISLMATAGGMCAHCLSYIQCYVIFAATCQRIFLTYGGAIFLPGANIHTCATRL